MTRLDLTRDEIASAFYNSKYGVTLSGETFGHLSRYLEASSNSLQSGDDHLKHPLTVARIFRAKIDLRIAPEPPTRSCSKSESTNQIRISKEEMRLERESAQAAVKACGIRFQRASLVWMAGCCKHTCHRPHIGLG